MLSGKKKGKGTDNPPRKDQDTRNLQSSKAKKQKQQEQVGSLAFVFTPVKNKPNLTKATTKKLLPVCKISSNQASLPLLPENFPKRE